VNALLQSWLVELRAEGLDLSGDHGGANQNLWCISLPTTEQITAVELVAFLQSAVDIRRELAAAQFLRPVTFYAWHDEVAGQLRFSTARCTQAALPFAATILLVPAPNEIVGAFMRSPVRDGIRWEALHEVAPEGDRVEQAYDTSLSVWAVDLSTTGA
jgi:hypothetical protein